MSGGDRNRKHGDHRNVHHIDESDPEWEYDAEEFDENGEPIACYSGGIKSPKKDEDLHEDEENSRDNSTSSESESSDVEFNTTDEDFSLTDDDYDDSDLEEGDEDDDNVTEQINTSHKSSLECEEMQNNSENVYHSDSSISEKWEEDEQSIDTEFLENRLVAGSSRSLPNFIAFYRGPHQNDDEMEVLNPEILEDVVLALNQQNRTDPVKAQKSVDAQKSWKNLRKCQSSIEGIRQSNREDLLQSRAENRFSSFNKNRLSLTTEGDSSEDSTDED